MVAIKQAKMVNTSRVMREIWIQRRVSRVDIAKTLGLNKSTITNIVNELIEVGLVQANSIGEAGPQGGRRPVFLSLNDRFGCVLGIELRPESYSAVAVDLDGDIVFSKTERLSISGSNLATAFAEIMDRLKSELSRAKIPLLGVGVGVPGVVDTRRQIIKYSIPLHIEEEFDFYQEISAQYSVPVFPENDANCCAWGELAFHREHRLDNFIFVVVEFREVAAENIVNEKTAVGIGIVIDGKVYRGAKFSAGEFRSVLRKKGHDGQFSLESDEAAVVDTDPVIRKKFIRELSRNLALIVNTFNLNSIVLGGDIELFQSEMNELLREEIENNWPYTGPVLCEIRFSTLGDRAVAYGAAGMVLDRLFMDLGSEDGNEIVKFGGIDLIPQIVSQTASP
jgi:predicted NBD/HSP70 family sugar kinase